DEELQRKALPLMQDACHDAFTRLRRGTGSGAYEVYAKGDDEKEATLKVRAKFKLYFDHKRFYLDFHVDKNEYELRNLDRQILIRDNSATYQSSFYRQFGPLQSRGDV